MHSIRIGEAGLAMSICNNFSSGMEGQKIGRNCLGLHVHVDALDHVATSCRGEGSYATED